LALSGHWVVGGDYIEIKPSILKPVRVFPLNLEVLYEDEFMALIKKPAGIAVSGNFHKTIQNALTHNISLSLESDALEIPRPVHRLDKMTAGLLIIAKTRRAQKSLGLQLEKKKLSKTYVAIVKGSLLHSGEINSLVNDLNSQTFFKNIRTEKSASYQTLSLVELLPKTGRTHQLRIHMSDLGHPIVGDFLYDSHKVLKGKGLFLFASKIVFTHPISQESLSFEIPIPNKFIHLINREKKRWEKFCCFK
jgi:RluA family pseudouridine synthase